jgi:hypothetical protein
MTIQCFFYGRDRFTYLVKNRECSSTCSIDKKMGSLVHFQLLFVLLRRMKDQGGDSLFQYGQNIPLDEVSRHSSYLSLPSEFEAVAPQECVFDHTRNIPLDGIEMID